MSVLKEKFNGKSIFIDFCTLFTIIPGRLLWTGDCSITYHASETKSNDPLNKKIKKIFFFVFFEMIPLVVFVLFFFFSPHLHQQQMMTEKRKKPKPK